VVQITDVSKILMAMERNVIEKDHKGQKMKEFLENFVPTDPPEEAEYLLEHDDTFQGLQGLETEPERSNR